MAKYCAKCGKALPDGVEICPDCHVAAQEDGAAPFTRMTAETEVWKPPEEQKRKPRAGKPLTQRTQRQKLALGIGAAAAVIAALVIFLIIYLQPHNRAVRAIASGDYALAAQLYAREPSLSSGAHDAAIDRAVLQSAEQILTDYAAHTRSTEEAADALNALGAVGRGGEALLAEARARFDALSGSRQHLTRAERLMANGDYLAARAEYMRVAEGDAGRAEAQEKAAECLTLYTEQVIAAANRDIQTGHYGAAVQTLEGADRALLEQELYVEKISYKLKTTYVLLEENLLTEAENLAGLEDYASAAELLRQNMERYGLESEALSAAMDGYLTQAQDKLLADAVARSDRLYAEGSFAEAFAALDDMQSVPNLQEEALEKAVEALETRFVSDRIDAAEEVFALKRENLPEAIALLSAAAEIRELDALRERIETLEGYLPASLTDMEYTSRTGTVFRQKSAFDSLDGTAYEEGWIWGANGADLTFALGGAYDRLEGTFANRRDDKSTGSAHFEVICDGVTAYTSETLRHPSQTSVPVSVDISGCETLVLRFVSDYAVETAAGGYCYHGLCSPLVTKDLPAAPADTAAEAGGENET